MVKILEVEVTKGCQKIEGVGIEAMMDLFMYDFGQSPVEIKTSFSLQDSLSASVIHSMKYL